MAAYSALANLLYYENKELLFKSISLNEKKNFKCNGSDNNIIKLNYVLTN